MTTNKTKTETIALDGAGSELTPLLGVGVSPETSQLYRAMVYTACATIWFYRASVDHTAETVEEFQDRNPEVVLRVFDEVLHLMDYELSWNQMDTAIRAYMTAHAKPQAVQDGGGSA